MKLAELLRDIEVVESHASPELEIADVAYDSRQVTKGAAFVAIRGFESDGHKYIPQAAEKGASCVICEEKPALDVPYVVVRDSRLALAVASKNFFGDPGGEMVMLGVTGTNGPDGGFALQEDFAGAILESAVRQSPLLNRLDRYTCSSAANAMRWLHADETDISTSVFGGIQMFWAAEGATVAASKPQFREMKLDLEKMMGFCYCTDEMLQDAAFLTGFVGNGFTLAADRLLTESVISGDGVGKPLGLLNSGAVIVVDKESSQAAGTFQGANVIKMQARAMPRGRDRMVWLIHPDLEEQLPYLAIQSGEAAKFLWNPEGGLGNFDTQRVLNKPVLFEDSCPAMGSKGDVMLVDPMQYILLSKGTAKQDWSIHVEFLTDQNCFRMVFRCNGAPKVNKPLKIKNSSKTRSPFVALAART